MWLEEMLFAFNFSTIGTTKEAAARNELMSRLFDRRLRQIHGGNALVLLDTHEQKDIIACMFNIIALWTLIHRNYVDIEAKFCLLEYF